MSPLPAPVRILRHPQRHQRLLLDDGSGLYDLSQHLRKGGLPDDLLELAADGWFDPTQLEDRLPRGGETQADWTIAEGITRDDLLEQAAVPIPSSCVGKILALGKNFRAHAEEFQEEVPNEPLFFNKLPETLVGHGEEIRVAPWYAGRVDHEVELAVIIGLEGRDINEADAMDHVAFYSLANDLTARSLQGSDRKIGFPWLRAKNMDGFCPLGPALVPAGYLDPTRVQLSAHVQGELRQSANTSDMVVSIPAALAYLSKHLTLRPGDIVLMGTPAGVGPLEDGDRVTCQAEPIGTLQNTIRRPNA